MTALGILVAVIAVAVAFVAWLAYCEDVRSREIEDDYFSDEDWYAYLQTVRDRAPGPIDRTTNPWWHNHEPVAEPCSVEALERAWRDCINSAVPGRDECGQPTEQVANSSDPVNGLPRGGGLGGWGAPDPEATPSSRASGEAAGHD